MANYDFWAIGASSIAVSGGGTLDGSGTNDGAHLLGLSITITSYAFENLVTVDNGQDLNVDDDDGNQRLQGNQTFDGQNYTPNTPVEAEYIITLRDAATGDEFRAIAINIVGSDPDDGSIEGLAFIGPVPPRNVALEVIAAEDGPGNNGQDPINVSDITIPACFTPGTLIDVPGGACPVEDLRIGDLVMTLDSGPQPLLWVGQTEFSAYDLAMQPMARPILIRRDAFGPGRPARDLRVSPQHRILIDGARAELLFGEPQVLAAAWHLIDDQRVVVDDTIPSVTYIHVQCAAHEILMSNGLPSESYNPAAVSSRCFDAGQRAALNGVLPGGLSESGPSLDAARPIIKRHEAALWRSAA